MDRHLNRIHSLAWYMTGDRSQAEDIAQETFLRFWQAASKWDETGKATILTWLRRVATRLCMRVQTAILSLPERQRAALTLSYYQHLSQSEGAAVMGIKEKAYESLLSRAKTKLKLELLPEKESLRQ